MNAGVFMILMVTLMTLFGSVHANAQDASVIAKAEAFVARAREIAKDPMVLKMVPYTQDALYPKPRRDLITDQLVWDDLKLRTLEKEAVSFALTVAESEYWEVFNKEFNDCALYLVWLIRWSVMVDVLHYQYKRQVPGMETQNPISSGEYDETLQRYNAFIDSLWPRIQKSCK